MVYLRSLITTTLLILTASATVNFLADPGGVYRQDHHSARLYADALIQSRQGLWWPEGSMEDREIKKALTKYSNQFECIVIGSSHVMQVGSARSKNALTHECASILNLGVSGAGIEDHFALTYLSLENGHPRKIVLGIDPWTVSFGQDLRWQSFYQDEYAQAKKTIQGDSSWPNGDHEKERVMAKWRNLLSLEYTIQSVRRAVLDIQYGSDRSTAHAAPELDSTSGGENPVFLRDGSIQYSAKFIAQSAKTPIPLGGEKYKMDGVLNDKRSIDAYRSLLRWIMAEKVEPILLLIPYHQNVWKSTENKTTRALKATEQIARQLANELGLKVIGAYDPDIAGCLSTEFYDSMHAKNECLSKLNVSGK